MMEHLIT